MKRKSTGISRPHISETAFQQAAAIQWLLHFMPLLIAQLLVSAHSVAAAAAENIATPPDTNSWAIVENAIVKGDETTVFFLTRPDIRDPEARNPCALNYYSVKLKPGLAAASPTVIAKGVCGGAFQKSRLLDNGDALIIVRDRLERWRAGKKISARKFSSISAVSKLGVSTDMSGGQFYDIAPDGSVVLVIQSGDHSQDRQEYAGSPLVMTALTPDNKQRWESRFSQQGVGNTVKQVWAGSDGSALLYTSFLESGLTPSEEARLNFVSAQGSEQLIVLNESGEAMDIQKVSHMSPQEAQKYLLQQQQQLPPEAIDSLHAVARTNGGFDVLFRRKGGGEERQGFFLYRIGPDGDIQSRIALGKHIEMHGLERWFDFSVEAKELTLLSSAAVTQKVAGNVKRKWSQNIVSWIDLDTGTPTPRLIPLDERYLEAAMSAGDEGQQYLEGQPGSKPVLLTRLGGKPLVVSVGWISKRQVLRLHEADKTLVAFTEVVDERQASLTSAASRKQRSAERDARKQRIGNEMAAAAGMSAQEFKGLSKREQKKALVRSGNYDQLMQSMMGEAQAAQAQHGLSGQKTPQQQAGTARDMNAQIAAAMSQVQQELDNNPNMTPQMRAQLAAMMSQTGQGPGGMPTQATSQAGPGQAAALPDKALTLDAAKRGFIEFENPGGKRVTLLIIDRQSGRELLKKDYSNGVIYEYVDFGRFKLPLERIGVSYREAGGLVLKDLTPAIGR